MTAFRSILAMMTLLTLLGAPANAFAHSKLLSESPAADSRVESTLTELRLQFSEGLEIAFTRITITGPVKVETGAPALDPTDDALLIVPILKPMGAGRCTVTWRVVSKDGHASEGTYSFSTK